MSELIVESVFATAPSENQPRRGETCPVCCGIVDQPHRLACGHTYCSDCLHHFLLTASDIKQFPLSCMGDDKKCGILFPLPVIRRFIRPNQLQLLLLASFHAYLDQHPESSGVAPPPTVPESAPLNLILEVRFPDADRVLCLSVYPVERTTTGLAVRNGRHVEIRRLRRGCRSVKTRTPWSPSAQIRLIKMGKCFDLQ